MGYKDYHDYHISMMRPTQFKCSKKNLINDNISVDGSFNEKQNSQHKGKMKEKIYIIKEHKVVNSFTRVNINDEEIKDQLEREIKNRTSTLKKCQNILRNMSTDGVSGEISHPARS